MLSRSSAFSAFSAEEIRDSALAISGLLIAKIGGPSVMPYQPSDFYKGRYETWPWTTSKGDDQYRRGMYTFWRRTTLHPMFAIFDAPSREECSVARSRTNTPLQALVTLNDPTFVEAARVFAQKVLRKPRPISTAAAPSPFAPPCSQPQLPRRLRVLRARYDVEPETIPGQQGRRREAGAGGSYPQPAGWMWWSMRRGPACAIFC